MGYSKNFRRAKAITEKGRLSAHPILLLLGSTQSNNRREQQNCIFLKNFMLCSRTLYVIVMYMCMYVENIMVLFVVPFVINILGFSWHYACVCIFKRWEGAKINVFALMEEISSWICSIDVYIVYMRIINFGGSFSI